MSIYKKLKIFKFIQLPFPANSFKGYLHYKTITPQSVLSEAQVKNFFIS